ncbi:hypothetical protein [Streptomyces sp. NPDC059970]|uniref:hypothetical protein n=1 Tax=Streptomyces sp. NPDC059970 TaxID=3347019 RepID=UPI00369F40AA
MDGQTARSVEDGQGVEVFLNEVRSDLLEAGWCPGDPEDCTDDRHSAAYVAWEFLVEWARKDEEGRRHDRDFLDYCLRSSATLTEMQVTQALSLT